MSIFSASPIRLDTDSSPLASARSRSRPVPIARKSPHAAGLKSLDILPPSPTSTALDSSDYFEKDLALEDTGPTGEIWAEMCQIRILNSGGK